VSGFQINVWEWSDLLQHKLRVHSSVKCVKESSSAEGESISVADAMLMARKFLHFLALIIMSICINALTTKSEDRINQDRVILTADRSCSSE